MRHIRRLPDSTINRIAAGEVIERPAAAIKELVENSLDAEATKITVQIKDGGKTFIRISDNGTGIPYDQMELAFERHATSKLEDDTLLTISHLGFRGEALASIASVSRVTLQTRVEGEIGYVLCVNGGTLEAIKPTSTTIGTHIEVKDLFYATPARLKFLQSDRSETMAITDTVKRLAMANPNVDFILEDLTTGKTRTTFEARTNTQDLLNAHVQRIGDIVGKEFLKSSLDINTQRDDINLKGWIGLPGIARGTSSSQYIFVNGRPIKDKTLTGALKAAYQDVLPYGKHPIAALFLTLDPDSVDVNVHPAKTEVRFRNAGAVRGMIISTIRTALASQGHQGPAQTLTPIQEGSASKTNIFGPTWAPKSSPFFMRPPTQQDETETFSDVFEPQGPYGDTDPQDYDPETGEIKSFPLGHAVAHLYDTYILAQTEDAMVLIDAHAAHERIVYEKLKAHWREGPIASQPLLVPDIVSLTKEDVELLLYHKETLSQIGLDIESFGGDTIMVRALPFVLTKSNSKLLLEECIAALEEGNASDAIETKIDAVMSSIACHGSVRAGRRLKIEEMNSLLREMEQTPNSGQCNHGRPTSIALTKAQISALFGRT
jgi:DNA mismatch repair protein MutL